MLLCTLLELALINTNSSNLSLFRNRPQFLLFLHSLIPIQLVCLSFRQQFSRCPHSWISLSVFTNNSPYSIPLLVPTYNRHAHEIFYGSPTYHSFLPSIALPCREILWRWDYQAPSRGYKGPYHNSDGLCHWRFRYWTPCNSQLYVPTNCSKLTSLCNWDSLFVFLPKYMCLSLLLNFLTSHTCHLITTFVVLTLDFAEFVLLPRTSCFLVGVVAYTPSWLKHLIFSATYMSPYLFRLLCSVQ